MNFWLISLLVMGSIMLGVWAFGRRWYQKNQCWVELVLTPPLVGGRGLAPTADFFLALSKLMANRPVVARVFHFRPTWQLFVRACPKKGCQFIFRLPKPQQLATERLLVGYWPTINIRSQKITVGRKLKLAQQMGPAKNFELPGKAWPDWNESDPFGYLTSQLGEIAKKGLVIYSLKLQAKSIWQLDILSLFLAGINRLANGLLTFWQPPAKSSVEAVIASNSVAENPQQASVFSASVSLLAESRLISSGAVKNLRPALGLLGLKPTLFGTGFALNSTQTARLWHFPNSKITPADNLTHTLSQTLPLPTELLVGPSIEDLIIGVSNHRGHRGQPIYLTPTTRQRHTYIVGGTGAGKTTMIKDQIIQDIRAGRGIGVIDPHGDLASELLDFIPPDRIDDLVYINPDDCERPTHINLLELDPALEGLDLERQKDLVTESTVSILRKLFASDGEGGHRIEYVLRNTIQTALALPKPNLFTIYDLLQDYKVRQAAMAEIADFRLKLFWHQELGRAGDFQRIKMTAGVTTKIGRFLFSTPTRLTFGATKSSINFGQIMDEGKILICDLSRGKLGEDSSRLFGAAILAKIQLAALARARQPFSDRQPFYLYVDEFQNFASSSFVEMMSESRKYQVLLTIAEQSTQQQSDQKLIEVILANVGTVVAFRLGSMTDLRLIGPLLEPRIKPSDLLNLPAHSFYGRSIFYKSVGVCSGNSRLASKGGYKNVIPPLHFLKRSPSKYGVWIEPSEGKVIHRHEA